MTAPAAPTSRIPMNHNSTKTKIHTNCSLSTCDFTRNNMIFNKILFSSSNLLLIISIATATLYLSALQCLCVWRICCIAILEWRKLKFHAKFSIKPSLVVNKGIPLVELNSNKIRAFEKFIDVFQQLLIPFIKS